MQKFRGKIYRTRVCRRDGELSLVVQIITTLYNRAYIRQRLFNRLHDIEEPRVVTVSMVEQLTGLECH